MNHSALKAGLRIAITEAIREVGIETLKATSLFPLSRRSVARGQKQAA